MALREYDCPQTLATYEGVLVPGTEREKKLTEQEIALVMQRYLEESGHETFPEVELKEISGRTDLIALRRGIVTVVECKVAMSLTLLEQATKWHDHQRYVEAGYAQRRPGMPHLIYVAVGKAHNKHSSAFQGTSRLLQELIVQYRIGVMSVTKTPETVSGAGGPHETVIPVSYQLTVDRCADVQPGSRRAARTLIGKLNPDTRIATPGSRGGRTIYMTDFKRTAIKMAKLMLDGQPRTLRQIIQKLNSRGGHHYRTDTLALGSLPASMAMLGYTEIGNSGGIGRQYQGNLPFLRRYLESHGLQPPSGTEIATEAVPPLFQEPA